MSKQRGNSRRFVRSIAFLTIWIVFGGIVVAGWLTQLSPNADRSLPFLDELDSEPATGGQTIPAASEPGSDPLETVNPFAPIGGTPAPSNGASGTTARGASGATAATSGTKGLGTAPKPISPKPLVLKDCPTSNDASVAHPFGCQLSSYIGNLYLWALVIGAGLAVMMIMWAGYTYVISAGDPEAVRVAKDYLWGALLGLMLLILTYTIFNVLRIGVPGQTTSSSSTSSAGNGSPTSTNGGTVNQSGGAPQTSGGAPNPSQGGSSPPAPSVATDIFGTYAATLTDIRWSGTCGDAPNDPRYAKGSTQTVSISDVGGGRVSVSALGQTVEGVRAGNAVSVSDKGVTATFNAAAGSVRITVNYTKTVLFASCTVTATVDGQKSG